MVDKQYGQSFVVGSGGYDLTESRADNDCHCQVKYITAHDEVFKILEQF
jgi:hypothetical protein